MGLKKILNELTEGRRSFSDADLFTAFCECLDPAFSSTLKAAFLTALRLSPLDARVLVAGVRALREGLRIPAFEPELRAAIDTCGTGGDGHGTFNISTTAALIAAGAGVRVAKHGNRQQTSASGSADVLQALGLNLSADPFLALHRFGFGFFFAPDFFPGLGTLAPLRRELGFRTVFNILGPLVNPIDPHFQVVGVSQSHWLAPMAECLFHLQRQRAWVVFCEAGLDEITPCAPNQILQIDHGKTTRFVLDAKTFGFEPCSIADLKGGTPEENAQILLDILSGQEGPKRDAALLNAAAAIYVSGHAEKFQDAIAKAANAIASGQALRLLQAAKAASAGGAHVR